MRSAARSRRYAAILGTLVFTLLMPMIVLAEDPANQYFERTWERTDRQVATSEVSRTWMWGPSGFTASCYEPYYKLATGEREVQYFDKSRMEINDPGDDRDSEWYVTQGLLATEMITGNMQIGDTELIGWGPADVHIAGDQGGGAPSYAHFAPLMDEEPLNEGQTITQTIDGNGSIGDAPAMASYGVTAAEYVPATNHRVASVFWEFMNSHGPIIENGVATSGPLFENPYYAAGLPTTEAYWTNIAVGGVQQDVLVQAFERRVLTYTPGNDEGWKVEAGNVGQHYYIWRYGEIPDNPADACPETMHVNFHIYEPTGPGSWEQIAHTITREVWHPGEIATGTWSTYTEAEGETLVRNTAGIMVAEHSYTTFGGTRILSSLTADVVQIKGPVSGTAQIQAGNFSPGNDPRVAGSAFVGSGSVQYETDNGSGTIGFDVAGSNTTTFHVFLDGPAPPVFFQ